MTEFERIREIIQNKKNFVSPFYGYQKVETFMKRKLLFGKRWNLSNKVASKEKNENEKIIDKERDKAKFLNKLLSNIVSNVNIAQHSKFTASHPVLKTTGKHRNPPNILRIRKLCKKTITFSFSHH